ncbi:MAG TPA: hypothetical protein DIT64_02110 [Verrucomicrobiales bacterium]|nr:hypothetical protein [Verrucomicrobiales bacterium]
MFALLFLCGYLKEPGDGYMNEDSKEVGAAHFTFALYWVALISGTLFFSTTGALFSIFSRISDKSATKVIELNLFPVYLIGILFGLLSLLLFLGGFVSGTLFPDLEDTGIFRIYWSLSLSDWAKLFLWAFILGFSERLIPGFIKNLALLMENQFDAQNHAQQVGTGQPATRSESDSEDDDKPQPESEGRSR